MLARNFRRHRKLSVSFKGGGSKAENTEKQKPHCINDTPPIISCAPARSFWGTEPERCRWQMKRWRRVVQKQTQCKRQCSRAALFQTGRGIETPALLVLLACKSTYCYVFHVYFLSIAYLLHNCIIKTAEHFLFSRKKTFFNRAD